MTLAVRLQEPILAQMSRWERLGDGLRKNGGHRDLIDLWPVALLIILVATVAYAAVLWRRRKRHVTAVQRPRKAVSRVVSDSQSRTGEP